MTTDEMLSSARRYDTAMADAMVVACISRAIESCRPVGMTSDDFERYMVVSARDPYTICESEPSGRAALFISTHDRRQ